MADEIRAGKRVGPRILTSGRKLDMAKPAWPGSIAITSPDEAREIIRQNKLAVILGIEIDHLHFHVMSDRRYKG